MLKRMKFSDVQDGTAIRLENCYGTKIAPIPCEASRQFYASHGRDFTGWNFRYKFMAVGEEGLMSLDEDREVEVLPECYHLAIRH
jgi:hypothetical protein